jgi:hypothetical protein
MPLNYKQTKDKIRLIPFTIINGQPTQSDYELLKRKCCKRASKIEDVVFPWCTDNATGKEYGLLADILGCNKYNDLTATDIGTVPEQQPVLYGKNINNTTTMHQRKCMEEEWD